MRNERPNYSLILPPARSCSVHICDCSIWKKLNVFKPARFLDRSRTGCLLGCLFGAKSKAMSLIYIVPEPARLPDRSLCDRSYTTYRGRPRPVGLRACPINPDLLAAETEANLRAMAANKRLSRAARDLVEQLRARRATQPAATLLKSEETPHPTATTLNPEASA